MEAPHFVDLLKLEWVEIEVFMMRNHKVEFSPVVNWKEDVLVLNPYLQILHLEYPVHLIKKIDLQKIKSHIFYAIEDGRILKFTIWRYPY